jgi:hypothetical protein
MMSLEQWRRNGWLISDDTTPAEIADLLAVVDRELSIESLPLTVGMEFRDVSDQIEVASRRRGQAMYDHVGVVEERDAEVLIQTATTLRSIVLAFLERKYPNLMSR